MPTAQCALRALNAADNCCAPCVIQAKAEKAREKEAANKPVADWGGRFAGGDSRGFANAAAPAPAAAKTKGKKK